MRMDIRWQGILPTLKCHNWMCCHQQCSVGETFLTIGRLKSDSKGTRFWSSEDLTLREAIPYHFSCFFYKVYKRPLTLPHRFIKLDVNFFEHFFSFFPLNIQVSKCGKSGCKDEPLATKEEEQVFSFSSSDFLLLLRSWSHSWLSFRRLGALSVASSPPIPIQPCTSLAVQKKKA